MNANTNRRYKLEPQPDGSSFLTIYDVNNYELRGGSTMVFEVRGMINHSTWQDTESFTVLT